jgi:hypothetical protein
MKTAPKFNLYEVFTTRTKIMRRWEVTKPNFLRIMERHGIKPTLIGGRRKYRMSDIARIEAGGYDKPTPQMIRKAKGEVDAVAA